MLDFNASNIQRITLVTDAWKPQVNGVVTTLSQLVSHLRKKQIEIDVIKPNDYPHFPMPTYPEIPWVWKSKGLEDRILKFRPDAIHSATEGALGWKARRIALKHKLPYTSAYHTKYPEYIHARFPIPKKWIYALLRRFHGSAERTLVPAPSILNELKAQGFTKVSLMSRGVDTELLNPQAATDLGFQSPLFLYVGRIAPEKNLRSFLDLSLPGQKIVVGKGPDLKSLQQAYPDVAFVGAKQGRELASYYASADVFVFPSLTDTFGIVNLEAIACGTPVAAFPVTGPQDIISQGINGVLNEDLSLAIEQALILKKNPEKIAHSIPEYTWQAAAEQFLNHLTKINYSEQSF